MLTPEQQNTLLMEELGAVRAESELRKEVDELRRDMAMLRMRSDSGISRDALEQERNNREVGEAAFRQLAAKLEEAISRETVAIRADNADLRASLTESLRLLSEERKERQSQFVENSRRIKDLTTYTEDRAERLESLAKGAESNALEVRSHTQEVGRQREMTEFRSLSAVAEESRNREVALQQEQQARETMFADLEQRLRALVLQERDNRGKELDLLTSQISRCEDNIRNERELTTNRTSEATIRAEDIMRAVSEESRYRSEAVAAMSAGMDEIRQMLKQEARERNDNDNENFRRASTVEGSLQSSISRMEEQVSILKQQCAENRAANQVEASVREEGIARLQAFLDEEMRTREEANAKEAQMRDASEARLEQHLRNATGEIRTVRETSEHAIEQKITALQHEFNFEKAKAAAQARELSQSLSQSREALNAETSARRQEMALLVKAVEEVRESTLEISSNMDKMDARLQEQITILDKWLGEERATREAADRQAMTDRTELQDGLARLARVQADLESAMMNAFNEERRLREEATMGEAKVREEADNKIYENLQRLINEEESTRQREMLDITQRVATESNTRGDFHAENEEQWRINAARIAQLSDSLTEARGEVRRLFQKAEDFESLRESLAQESVDRQTQERNLELSMKENQVRLDQLSREREQAERRFDQRVTEIVQRLENDHQVRSRGIEDQDKKFSDFANDHVTAQKAHKRELEDFVSRMEKAIHDKHADEQRKRENSFNILQEKSLELREGVDEVRKWRSEQYNELILELAKLTEMITEETKSRQQQDQVLAGEVHRLREETTEEVNSRKVAVGNVTTETRDLLLRLEKDRDEHMSKEKERWQSIESINESLITEGSRRDAAITELRQLIDRESMTREEVIQGATRAWQRANAKTNEDWRAAVRADTVVREEGQLRLEQQIVDLRTAVQENSAINEQQTEEIRTRFKACQEQISMEELARKTEDVLLQKSLEDLKGLISSEQAERGTGEQHAADRFVLLENQLRDEALLREDSERRTTKELLEITGRLQVEQVAREESDIKLEQRINQEANKHEENHAMVCKAREVSEASTMESWQRGLRELQLVCERDRKDSVNRHHQLQQQQAQEHDDRLKADRELSQALARLQSLGKEEEESRIEQGERLGAAIESIHDAVRVLGPQREEILKKSMEAVDQVRALLNKEVVARSERGNMVDESLREIRLRLTDEVQSRENAVRSCEEALMEERTMREDQLARERRTTEEEIQRALQAFRKQREDETRKLQERLLEVSGAISEERDLRQEAFRQERQKVMDIKEQLVRDQKNMERETVKVSQQMMRQLESEINRAKEVDMAIGGLHEKCDSMRGDFGNEVHKRNAHLQSLENKMMETHSFVQTESKAARSMHEDMRKTLEEEVAAREAIISTDRRAREAGDMQVANTLKNTLRDEREARDKELGKVMQELATLKTSLVEEGGRREDDKSQHSLAIQKIRTEMTEMIGERKVDNVSMREAFLQVTEEVKVVQRSRKEDVDRLDSVLAGLSARVDGNSRVARDQCVSLEQTVSMVTSDLRQLAEDHSSTASRLENKIYEERRSMEQDIAADKRALEMAITNTEQAVRQNSMEEVSKARAMVEKLGAKVGNLESDLDKSRSSGAEQARELARGIAALQGVASAEEQARQQSAWQLQQHLDGLREEMVKERKERSILSSKAAEDMQNIQRTLSARDERDMVVAQKHAGEVSDLRDRLSRELRQREASISQVEQRLLSFQAVRDGTPASAAIRLATPTSRDIGAPEASPSKELASQFGIFQREAEEEIGRQRRQLQDMIAEQQMITKSVSAVSDRVDGLRSGLNAAQNAIGEVQMKQRMLSDVETQVRGNREELAKEVNERRADSERIGRLTAQTVERIEILEQKRMVVETELKQNVLDVNNTLKKEARERDAKIQALSAAIREETQKREEGFEREERLRHEYHERGAEAFRSQLREERRIREKEVMRIEGRSLANKGSDTLVDRTLGGSGDAATLTMECRSLARGFGDLQERLAQTEARQKSAEERTVSMLDAIMSGLTQPGE